MLIGANSLRELILADRLEVGYLTELRSYFIRAMRGSGEYVLRDKTDRPLLFDNEAAAWKLLRRYRDLDSPGLVD